MEVGMALKKWLLYEAASDRAVGRVDAENGEEALDQYDPESDLEANWPTQWGPVEVRIDAYAPDTGEWAYRRWMLPQDPPPCEDGEDHQWAEGSTYGGPGATLEWVDVCRICGVRRETVRYPAENGRRLFKVSYI
jgi:hypothetical protein